MDNIKIKEERGIKLSSTQENLLAGLNAVSRISSKNVNLPILQNVLLKVDDNFLRLSTTNLEIAISCIVRGKIEQSGEFTVPARVFAEYINALPQGKIDLSIKGKTLCVSAGSSKTSIQGISASEFPVIPHIEDGKKFLIKINTFKNAAQRVLFSVAQNEAARPELSGVFFRFNEIAPNTLIMVATDSYRLGEIVVNLIESSEKEAKHVIVPAKTVAEITRILSGLSDELDDSETLTITVAENQIQFETGNTELISRIIEGEYPDYRQIIPTKFKTETVISRTEFIQSVKATSLFAKAGLFDVQLMFEPGKILNISAADNQTGESETQVSCNTTGEGNKVVVNFRYLLDGLGAIKSEEVQLKLIDGSNPLLVLPNDKEEQYTYIVMPIKQ